MLKLSKTAIRELNKMYRAVLIASFAISAFTATTAMATQIINEDLQVTGNLTAGATSITSEENVTTTALTVTASNTGTGGTQSNITVASDDLSIKGGKTITLVSGDGDDAANGIVIQDSDASSSVRLRNTESDALVIEKNDSLSHDYLLNVQGNVKTGAATIAETVATGTATALSVTAENSSSSNSSSLKVESNGVTISGSSSAGSGTVEIESGTLTSTGLMTAKGGISTSTGTGSYADADLGDTTVSSLESDGDVGVGGGLTVGMANAISSTSANTLNMGNNTLTGVKGITLTDAGSTPKTATLSVSDTNTISTNNASLNVGTGSVSATTLNIGTNTSLSENSLVLSNGTNSSTLTATDDGLNISGAAKVNGALSTTGNTSVGGTLTSTGLITANNGVTIASGEDLTLGGTSVNSIATSTVTGSGSTSTLATTATVMKSAENATYTAKTSTADLAKRNITSNTTVNGAVDTLDTTIGKASELKTAAGSSYHTGSAKAMGNLTNGGTSSPASVVEALENIDQSMGKIHGLFDGTKVNSTTVTSKTGAHSNLAVGTTVEDHLVSLDNAVGDRTLTSTNGKINNAMATTSLSAGLKEAGDAIGSLNYTSTSYVHTGDDLTTAISRLDDGLSKVGANWDQLDSRITQTEKKVEKMDKQMKSGFASMAAVAGLKPNARACSDTQIALGGGYYRGTAGVALGAFHYVNDNLMLNIGGGYAGNQSATVSGGVSVGW